MTAMNECKHYIVIVATLSPPQVLVSFLVLTRTCALCAASVIGLAGLFFFIPIELFSSLFRLNFFHFLTI